MVAVAAQKPFWGIEAMTKERVATVTAAIALSGFLILALFALGCHKTAPAPVRRNPDVNRVVKDTARVTVEDTVRVTTVIKDTTGLGVVFKDTAPSNVFSGEGQTFRTPGQRQSLQATLKKERALWQAKKPRDYRFLLRVGCFCPGTRGWLLIEVRSGQPLRAWDRAGKSVALTDWNTFSIDGLYDNLERSLDRDARVQIAFDPRWHFPRYVSTVVLPGPDAWSVVEVRAFRPI